MNDALVQVATRWAAADAASIIALLLLATLRWWGFFWVAPLPGRNAVPIRTRFGLSLLLAVLVLPVLAGQSANATSPPTEGLQTLDEALSTVVGQLTGSPSGGRASLAPALLTLGLLAGSEFVLGLVLAFGMRIVLSGIQLAGALMDQQAGIALAEIFNPALQQRTTPTGDWLVWAAVVVFLAAPLNGDLGTAALMLDLFETLPVAGFTHVALAQDLMIAVVQQSLVLSLQLAMPLLAVMSLISLATGWASRAGRPLALWPSVVPLRLGLSLLLLGMGVAGSAELLLTRFSGWIDGTRELLVG